VAIYRIRNDPTAAEASLAAWDERRARRANRTAPARLLMDRLFLAWQLVTPHAQASFGKALRTVAQATLNIQRIEQTLVLTSKKFAQRVIEKF
jgi:hypothetical protein